MTTPFVPSLWKSSVPSPACLLNTHFPSIKNDHDCLIAKRKGDTTENKCPGATVGCQLHPVQKLRDHLRAGGRKIIRAEVRERRERWAETVSCSLVVVIVLLSVF